MIQKIKGVAILTYSGFTNVLSNENISFSDLKNKHNPHKANDKMSTKSYHKGKGALTFK